VSTAVPYEPTVAIYKNFGTTTGPGIFPRTITHAMGETVITKAPQRVVVLDTGERDAVIDMGIKPVGIIESSSTPSYLGDAVKGIPIMGTIAEPNLEVIAAAAPDLIISNKLRHEALYSKLSAIAPTVFGERAGLVWRHNYELYALAVGKEEQAGKTIEKYEARVKAMNAKLPTPRPTVSVIRVQSDSKLRYYQRANFIGILLADLGFPRPEGQNVDDFGLLNMGLETVGQYGDADLIVLSVIGGSTNAGGKELQESAVFKSLEGVKKGAVITVDDAVWIGGLGYLAADAVMDDLAKYFKVDA
jgi:iron complex transport system substrate-binding protein